MLLTLTIVIVTALLGWALSNFPNLPALLARGIVLLGLALGLGTHLYVEALDGGGIAGQAVNVPTFAPWLGAPAFRTDTLSAGLGAWCLLLVALLVVARMTETHNEATTRQVALYGMAAAILYSLVHAFNLLAFGIGMLLLVMVVWAPAVSGKADSEHDATSTPFEAGNAHSLLALSLGALCVLGAVLVIGRTTGGEYSLTNLSLSTLTGWSLTMIVLGVALWLGLAPFISWSARVSRGHAALVQAMLIVVPVATLLLRLQALVSAQGLAGSVPAGWGSFTTVISWLGGITAVAAGAGAIVWAGTAIWNASMFAYAGGLICWCLGLDNPAGRQAAVAILLAFGAARVALELLDSSAAVTQRGSFGSILLPAARATVMFSLAAVPITPGFVGVWLLGEAVAQSGRAALVMALAGAVILAACGAGLHLAYTRRPKAGAPAVGGNVLAGWLGLAGSALLIAGGVAPALWLDEATSVAGIAGGSPPTGLPWVGVTSGGGTAPLLLLGLAALVIALLGWLLYAGLRSGVSDVGLLLPAAMARSIEESAPPDSPPVAGPHSAPTPVWWLSLQWVEEGVWGFGALLVRLSARLGIGLERLESRYYVPISLAIALLLLFAITR